MVDSLSLNSSHATLPNGIAISVSHLSKQFKETFAVKDVSFSIPKGIVFSLLGPNGAGKSTIIRMLSAVLNPSSGTINVLGMPLVGNEPIIKHHIGVVPQENNLDPDFSVQENLEIFAYYHNIPNKVAKTRIEELLHFVKLWSHRKKNADKLSGGMKRRLILARSLLNDPDILILDEPTTGLDVQSRYAIWDMIKDLRTKGKTILLTSHYMAEAEELSDHILIIDNGNIIAEGSVPELRNLVYNGDVLEIDGDLPPDIATQFSMLGKIDSRNSKTLVYIADWKTAFQNLGTDIKNIPTFRIRPVTLEDVFVSLTGKDLRDI